MMVADFTALNTEAQRLIDQDHAAAALVHAAALAALQTQITSMQGSIEALQAALAACEAGTTPPPDLPPPPPPTGFVWPDATNTGVPAGTTLTAYTGSKTISVAGTVIDGKTSTKLTVTANNVTIKNSRITGGVLVGNNVTGFKMEDSEIIGTGQLSGFEGPGTVLRCEIRGFQNNMRLFKTFVVKGNWLHSPMSSAADPHFDGIEIYGPAGPGSIVEDNTINSDDTSEIFVSDIWGVVNGLVINHNRMFGSDMPMRVEHKGPGTISNVSVTNNVIKRGHWGYFDINVPVTKSGNVDLDTGASID